MGLWDWFKSWFFTSQETHVVNDINPEIAKTLDADYRNPPLPSDVRVLKQLEVTPEMTTWAKGIRDEIPMFARAFRTFDNVPIMARREWHTSQGATGKTGHFRGISLYRVLSGSQMGVEETVKRWQQSR